jgi:tripartite-type tricarboxylate transporter receptor subunit TctC
VPYPPGGSTDILARILQPRLSQQLGGRTVIVENRPGAASQIATAHVARAEPDGSTLLVSFDNHGINPAVKPKLPYDTFKDFAPITLLGSTPLVLVGHVSVPANTTTELVALAKKQPGSITYGAAAGASPHLAMAWFSSVAGIKLQFIPYRGQSQAQNDLLSGHIQLVFGNLPDVMPHVKNGKIKAYGIALAERSPLAPEIPTLAEAGYKGPQWDSWYGFVAPAKTPRDIVEKISAGVRQVLARPDVKERLNGVGLVPAGTSPDEFKTFLHATAASYAKILRANDIHQE